jgi:hypothetical protein
MAALQNPPPTYAAITAYPAISRKTKSNEEALFPQSPPSPSLAEACLLNGGQKILNWLVIV